MLQNRVVRYVLGAAVMAALGAVIGLNLAPAEVKSSLGDRVVVTTGAGAAVSKELPLTASDAKLQGWTDQVSCFEGKGRYFLHTDSEGNLNPLVLVFNSEDRLLGTYLTSKVELPDPWEHRPNGLQGVPSYGFEHWSLPIYFKDPTSACVKSVS